MLENQATSTPPTTSVVVANSVPYKVISWLLTGGLALVAALLTLNTYGSPETSLHFMPLAAHHLIVPVLLVQLGVRLKMRVRLPKLVSVFLPIVSVILGLGVAALSLYWSRSYPNAVFELTHLNLPQFTELFVLATVASLINQSSYWWRRSWKQVVLWLPVGVFGLFYFISLWHFNIFKEIVKEDRIVEYLQFWVLLLGGGWSVYTAIQSFGRKHLFEAVLYGLAGVVLLLVAGDEISWGQRLLGIETTAEVQEVNRQGELTLHNLYAVEWLVIYAYVIISLVGVSSRVIASHLPFLKKLVPLTAPYVTISYFAFSLLYFVQQLRVMWGIWHSWSEVAELSLYVGMVLWVILSSSQRQKISSVENQ